MTKRNSATVVVSTTLMYGICGQMLFVVEPLVRKPKFHTKYCYASQHNTTMNVKFFRPCTLKKNKCSFKPVSFFLEDPIFSVAYNSLM